MLMRRVKDFGSGVRLVGKKFVVNTGPDERITPEQQRIILREQDTFARAAIWEVRASCARYEPYSPPRQVGPAGVDVYG